MNEKFFNCFLYTDGKKISQLGVAVHEMDGQIQRNGGVKLVFMADFDDDGIFRDFSGP